MERDRQTRIIALVALVIGVVGISIGFAAFSNMLTISSSANVKPSDDQFDVNFSSNGTTETDGAVAGVMTGNGVKETYAEGEAHPTADEATIDNSAAPTIKGLKANFTEPGQTATYSFYAHNNGKYIAYLNSILFKNAIVNGEDAASFKKCVAKSTSISKASSDAISAACETIKLDVKINGGTAYTGSQDTITGHELAINAFEPIVVTITYEGDDSAAGGVRADEEFDVYFGDIVLTYDSVD